MASDGIEAVAVPSNVAASASSVTLLAGNGLRKGYKVYNDSSANLRVDESGGTASTTNFTYLLGPNEFYETTELFPVGAITGIWESATGSARVTEMT